MCLLAWGQPLAPAASLDLIKTPGKFIVLDGFIKLIFSNRPTGNGGAEAHDVRSRERASEASWSHVRPLPGPVDPRLRILFNPHPF